MGARNEQPAVRWLRRLAMVAGCLSLAACTAEADGGSDGGSATTAGIGDPVRDGSFEFVVRDVTCGRTQIGGAAFGVKAQGKYCFVEVKVENIKSEAQTMFGDNQYLFDQEGRKFSADTEAAIYLDDSNSLLEEINPGNSIVGTIVFDVPKSAHPAKIELHDSAFSGGVTVKL